MKEFWKIFIKINSYITNIKHFSSTEEYKMPNVYEI